MRNLRLRLWLCRKLCPKDHTIVPTGIMRLVADDDNRFHTIFIDGVQVDPTKFKEWARRKR